MFTFVIYKWSVIKGFRVLIFVPIYEKLYTYVYMSQLTQMVKGP